MPLQRRISYRIGFSLYYIAFVIYMLSIVIPNIWIYDKVNMDSETLEGRSVWTFQIRSCFAGHGYVNTTWRCHSLSEDYAKEKSANLKGAASLLVLAVLFQLAACTAIALYSIWNIPSTHHYHAEIMAGTASMLDMAGVLLYTSYTHQNVNVTYGPGYIANVSAIFIAYFGLLLTGVYNGPSIKEMTCLV